VKALVVSNMAADPSHPERGVFVRDQVAALRKREGVEVELFEFPPGSRSLAAAARELRRRYRNHRFDVVHAHYGLTALPALAVRAQVRAVTLHGSEIHHRRTLWATRLALRFIDLPAAASDELAVRAPPAARPYIVLPCGVNLERFQPISKEEARRQLGLPILRPYLLFPADPSRPEKGYADAVELAAVTGSRLLTLGGVDPEAVPLYFNAANAVVLPSSREGFGLAVLEALACNVPVFATPVGIHPVVLSDLPGTFCAPYTMKRWAAKLYPIVEAGEWRVEGRERAARFGVEPMAERVLKAWREALAGSDPRRGRGG